MLDASMSVTESDFLAALAAGLPGHGFWSAPAVVAVSGGADSVALLLGLHALAAARREPPRLLVAHARHDLRAEAAADADFVTDVAAGFGMPCVVREVRCREPDGVRGEGIEGRARRLRQACFASIAHEHGARHVVVAHTADDQAETILHRALRGTGLAGLAGMASARALGDGVSLLRPLLAVPRRDVRAYLASRGKVWVEDATNADVRYARNFLRHAILARCEAGPYPAASAALVRLGGQAAAVADAVRSAADHLLDAHARRQADGTTVLQTRPLAGLDRHLLAEIFVALWHREGWPRRDMTARHYAGLAALAVASADGAAETPPPIELPGAVRARVMAAGVLVVGCGG
ncbi:MAG: tRNA lysidine(34) synthetase TilS [Planctomycetia bacterium]